MDYEQPPRFQPDNSEAVRQRRVANHIHTVAKVIELPTNRHRVTPDTFIEDRAYDHALAWVKPPNNVIPFPKPEPPEDIVA